MFAYKDSLDFIFFKCNLGIKDGLDFIFFKYYLGIPITPPTPQYFKGAGRRTRTRTRFNIRSIVPQFYVGDLQNYTFKS